MQPSITLNRADNSITMTAGNTILFVKDGVITSSQRLSEMENLATFLLVWLVIHPIIVALVMCGVAIEASGRPTTKDSLEVQ